MVGHFIWLMLISFLTDFVLMSMKDGRKWLLLLWHTSA